MKIILFFYFNIILYNILNNKTNGYFIINNIKYYYRHYEFNKMKNIIRYFYFNSFIYVHE